MFSLLLFYIYFKIVGFKFPYFNNNIFLVQLNFNTSLIPLKLIKPIYVYIYISLGTSEDFQFFKFWTTIKL